MERLDGMWDRFTPDVTRRYKRGGKVAWPPLDSRPFKFDPFGEGNDFSNSPQSFYDSNNPRSYGNAIISVNGGAPIPMPSLGPTSPRAFRFDPFGDSDASDSPEYYRDFANTQYDQTYDQTSLAVSTVLGGLKNTQQTTFDPWGEESDGSKSPAFSYTSVDDSKVKCTVTTAGKIWAPVPRVPMGAALAAFEVQAFAALLPSPMSAFTDSFPPASFGSGSADEEKRSADYNVSLSAGSTLTSKARVERGVFTVFQEEEDAPITEVPREVNGTTALYQTGTTESMVRDDRGVFPVFREDDEDDAPAGGPVPRGACADSFLYKTGSHDMAKAMKDLLGMAPGNAKDEMARRLFGGGAGQAAVPNAPRMSTVPLPMTTTPTREMSDEEVYRALVPVPPQPSAYPNSLQLSLLRVLRQGY